MFCRHVFGNFSCGFRGISRFLGNFAEMPEFRGSATARNMRSPDKSIRSENSPHHTLRFYIHYCPHISLFSSGFAKGELAFRNWQLMILVTRVRSANIDPWSLDISLRWLLKTGIVKKPTWLSLRRLVRGGGGGGWGKLIRIMVNSSHGKTTGLHPYMHYDKCKIRPFCWKGIVL